KQPPQPLKTSAHSWPICWDHVNECVFQFAINRARPPMTPHFKPDTAALLLIDFQVGTLQLARTTPGDEALRNAVILAKAAKVLGMPIVLTSSQEDRVQDRQMSALSASRARH